MDINNSNENKQDNTNNQKTLNSSIKDEKSSENVKKVECILFYYS